MITKTNFDAPAMRFDAAALNATGNFKSRELDAYYNLARNDSVNDSRLLYTSELNYIAQKVQVVLETEEDLFQFVRPNFDIPAYAEDFSVEIIKGDGKAEYIGEYTDNVPLVNVSTDKRTYGIWRAALGTAFTWDDIVRSRVEKIPLKTFKIQIAMKKIKQLMNESGWLGYAPLKIPGWLNNADVEKVQVAGANTAAKKWSAKTPEARNSDIVAIFQKLRQAGKTPNSLMLAPDFYNMLTSEVAPLAFRLAVDSLKSLLQSDIQINTSSKLYGAFPGGTDGFIVYDRNDPGFYQAVPQMPLLHPEQVKMFVHTIVATAKYGGTILQDPSNQIFAYGI